MLSLYVGLFLRFTMEGNIPGETWRATWDAAPLIALIFLLFYTFGGSYSVVWRTVDVEDLLRLIFLGITSGLACAVLSRVLGWGVPLSVLAFASALAVLASGMSRMVWRMLRGGRLRWKREVQSGAVMVIGAGEAGAYVLSRYLGGNHGYGTKNIILLDNDPEKKDRRVHGITVCGTSADIERYVQAFDIKEIIIAIPSLAGEAYTELISRCNATKAHVRVVADPHRAQNGGLQLRELDISDFLSREQVLLDVTGINEYIQGKVVLVSGGGGSIGSELCRQVMRFSPKQLIIFDIYENDAYALLSELRQQYGAECPARILIGSIRDRERLQEVFSAYAPQVVFHAAAHKHVPLMEDCPGEAVKNNVFGTMNLLDVASKHGVERFVQLSTDKAVNPSCVMGATKRVAEMLNQLYASISDMKCMVVRFGNVLGSHGSVIPLFESQIKAGGPVTVTDPDVTRYFMTIREAAQLVLQAGSLAESGATYVLEMGTPVRILDLAHKLIRFYGYEPNVDMDIAFTGLREGEKLHEELMTDVERENLRHTAHKKIMISPRFEIDETTFYGQLEALKTLCGVGEAQRVVAALAAISGLRGVSA